MTTKIFSLQIAVNCRDLNDPPNGQVVQSGFTPAQSATYMCNSGYQMVGNKFRVCQNNGQWNGTAISCVESMFN